MSNSDVSIAECILPAGTPIWRLHKRKYDATSFNNKMNIPNGRFSPLVALVGGKEQVIGTFYAGAHQLVAIAETVMRKGVDGSFVLSGLADLQDYNMAHLELVRDLNLLDLNRIQELKPYLDEGVTAYPTLQRFGVKVASLKQYDGFCWDSHQLGYQGIKAMVLFDNRCQSSDFTVKSSDELLGTRNINHLKNAARDLGVTGLKGVLDAAAGL